MGKMILKHEHWGPWESKPPRQESKMNNDKIARAVDLIVDLGWEEQRMSRSGKETYNELCKLFKVMTTNETREILKKEKVMGKAERVTLVTIMLIAGIVFAVGIFI